MSRRMKRPFSTASSSLFSRRQTSSGISTADTARPGILRDVVRVQVAVVLTRIRVLAGAGLPDARAGDRVGDRDRGMSLLDRLENGELMGDRIEEDVDGVPIRVL